MNDIYEFAIQMTETSLRELTIDPVYHLREAKECPVFLAVFEKYTGMKINEVTMKPFLTILHSERPKLYAILAFLSAIGLR